MIVPAARCVRSDSPGGAAGAGSPPFPSAAAVQLERAQARIDGRVVWSDVSVDIGAGQFAAILGPNGAGKTTLLRVLLGELPLAAGRASVLGSEPGARKREIGYLPQRRLLDASARIRGVDLVRLGLDGARWGLPLRPSRSERVEEVLALVGAAEDARRPIGQLSGGEQQRLLIAQALVGRPALLILDEPLLARVCRQQRITVLLVAHDVNPLLSYLDGVVYFGAGRALAGPPREVITGPTLSRLYGVPIEVLEASDGRRVVVGLPEPPARHSARHGAR